MIVSLGEALIDRIHGEDGTEPTTQIGGSPYNVAIALSRLEVDAGFVCPLSSDGHGDLLNMLCSNYVGSRALDCFLVEHDLTNRPE